LVPHLYVIDGEVLGDQGPHGLYLYGDGIALAAWKGRWIIFSCFHSSLH
jgi:hypothetical protein